MRRRMLDVSQKRLAELIGVHRNAVSYWEHGLRQPSHEKFVAAAIALGSPPWELYDVLAPDGSPLSRPWKGRGK